LIIMESPLKIMNLFELLNPKPPYECKSIRQNPDLISLQHNEPSLFRDSYTEYVMKSGMTVYTREIQVESFDYDEDIETDTEIEIISKDDWELLPVRSDGELAKFEKILQQKVWESRKNGINHYHPWHEPVYYIDEMLEKIPIPQLQSRIPNVQKWN